MVLCITQGTRRTPTQMRMSLEKEVFSESQETDEASGLD